MAFDVGDTLKDLILVSYFLNYLDLITFLKTLITYAPTIETHPLKWEHNFFWREEAKKI